MDMNSTTVAAWTGAIVSILVLVWDIYKEVKNGARLLLIVSPNMRLLVGSDYSGESHISVSVSNNGTLPTTLTHLSVCMYDTYLSKVLGKPSFTGIVYSQPSYTPQLPFVLNPGERWLGMVSQANICEHIRVEGDNLIYVAITHSSSSKPTKARVRGLTNNCASASPDL